MEDRKRQNQTCAPSVLLAAAFALSFALTLLVYALRGIAPFGDNTLVFSDANGQYLSFWVYFRDAFLGRQDFLYALEKTLGGNIAGLYAYYGASPFELLFLLFPKEQAPLAMHLIVLLKLSCCGLTMAIYFRHSGGLNARSLLLTAAYSLCGYNVCYFWSAMWLDGVILLPLIALGLRRLFEGKSSWLYLFSLAAAILFNYYIGYMLCLFSVLYALFLLWSNWRSLKNSLWRRLGTFALSSLAAGALPAFLLVPAVLSLQGGKSQPFRELLSTYVYETTHKLLEAVAPALAERTGSLMKAALLAGLLALLLLALGAILLFRSRRVPEWGKMAALAGLVLLALLYGQVFEEGEPFLYKLLTGDAGVEEILLGGPNLYVGLLPLVLALAFFLNGQIPRRERMGALLLVLALLFSLRFYIPDLIWHGFTTSTGFHYRYAFIFSFFLLSLAKEALDAPEGFRPWHGAVILAALALLAGVGLSVRQDWAYFGLALAAAALFCAYILGLDKKKSALRTGVAVAAVGLHLASLAWPLYANVGHYEDYFDTSASAFREEARQVTDRLALLEETDSGLWRSRLGGGLNGGMLYGYKDVAHFSSTERADLPGYLARLGISKADDVWANSDNGSTRAFDSLFGIRYLTGAVYLGEFETLAGSDVYVNPWALPLAFPASPAALDFEPESAGPFENLNGVYRSLCPELELDVFRPVQAQRQGESGLEALGEDAYVPASGQTEGEIRYQLTVDSSDPIYLSTQMSERYALDVFVDGEYIGTQCDYYTWRPLCLGSFAPGQELTVSLRTAQTEEAWPLVDRPLFAYESGQALASYHEAIVSAGDCRMESETDSRFRVRASLPEGHCLLLTVPYEEAWQVTVDGEPARAEKALGMLLAVPLEAGEHLVELRYTPPGLRAGTCISAGAAALTAWAFLPGRKKGKKELI